MRRKSSSRRRVRGGMQTSLRRRSLGVFEPLEARLVLSAYTPLAPTTQMLWTTGYFTPTGSVNLQGAAAAASNASTMAATLPTVQVTANGLPLLQSRANGAGLELFLDFSFENGYYHPYSTDGDRSTFNPTEQLAIFNAWREVAAAFSFLDVNVTTVLPVNNHNFQWVAITNEFVWGGEGAQPGIGQTRQAYTSHTFVDEGNVPALIHEIGHNLGMWHNGDYDYLGAKTHEYTNGIGQRDRTFMGSPWYGTAATYRFYNGRTSEAAWASQDQIGSALYWVSTTVGGDGYRPDDYGNTYGSALNLGDGSGAIQRDGYIERPGDNDIFRFTPATSGRWTFAANPLYLSTARPIIQLEDAAGKVIAIDDDAGMGGATFAASFTAEVSAGQTYYVRVKSDGDYSSMGYYNLAISPLPENFKTTTIGNPFQAGNAAWDPATNTLTHLVGGADTWTTVDQEQFTYATLTGDGVITARIDGVDNIGPWTRAGVEIRQSSAHDAARVYIGRRANGLTEEIVRSSGNTNAFNPTGSPGSAAWVRIERFGNRFDYSISADGVTWTAAGSVTVAMTGPVMIGFNSSAWSNRVPAAATFSNLSVEGRRGGAIGDAAPAYNALPAPTNVTATAAPGQTTDVVVNWTSAPGAQGYGIERSNNGVDYYWIANVDAATTTYRDTGTTYSKTWFYRVHTLGAANPWSAPSEAASVWNKPNAAGMTWGYTSPDVIWNATEIFINWNDAHGETGYRIERSTDNVNFVVDRTVAANTTTANFGGLVEGSRYWFKIVPTSPRGDGVPLVIASYTKMEADNFRFTAKTPTSMTIAWADEAYEDGFRVERSTNGNDWSLVATVPANTTTYTDTNVVAGGEYYYRMQPYSNGVAGYVSGAIFAAAPAASLPAGWVNTDIGAVAGGAGGGGAAVSTAAGAWTTVTGGNDILGTADAFNFTYRTLNAAIDTSAGLIVRVDGVEATTNAAKAGVVLRQDLSPGSKSVAIMMNAGGGYGIDVRTRTTAGGGTTYQQALANVTAPYWLRLTRSGTSIVAAYSTNGTTWTTAATIPGFTLSGNYYLGLGSTSNSGTQLSTSTFTNVQLTGLAGAPTVAVAAAATPSPATATSVALSVLGADNGGEAALAYSWSATGPGAVTYSANGTNGAKNTTATFSAAGTYLFTATITDAGGLSTTSTVSVNVQQTVGGLAGASPTMASGTSQQISLTDQFGAALTSGPPVTWSASAGSISAAGVYTAPASAVASVTITAQAGSETYKTYVSVADPLRWYKANENGGTTLADATAGAQNGALNGAASFSTGVAGNALTMTGGNASLPAGIVSGVNNFTIATWIKADSLDSWSRIFDFGTGTTSYMFLTPRSGANNLRFAITTSGGGGEQQLNGPMLNAGSWYHVAVTLNGNLATLYVNGSPVATNAAMTLRPSSLGNTTLNYLGKSQYNDPAFMGSVDDFRIYGRSLTAAEVQSLVTPRVITPAASTAPTVSAQAALSVLGMDQTAGEPGLIYTWSVTGTPPAAVVFSANGTNGAKLTTASFTQAGVYQFQVTILNPATGRTAVSATSVTVAPSQAGDYDGDGVVSGGDFLAWQRQLGSAATPSGSGADGSGNGTVDEADLVEWRDHFGEGASVAAAAPEVAAAVTASETEVIDAALVALAQREFEMGGEAAFVVRARPAFRPSLGATMAHVTIAAPARVHAGGETRRAVDWLRDDVNAAVADEIVALDLALEDSLSL